MIDPGIKVYTAKNSGGMERKMIKNKFSILLVLILIFSFTNIVYTGSISAASKQTTTKKKDVSSTYKGILKTKNKKYGIEIKNSDGTKKYYAFDTKGQKLAKELVSSSKIKDGAAISVIGTIKNNVLQVKSITEDAVKEQTFNGWLGDTDCSPNRKDPTQMGADCLNCTHCEASGYGISIKQKDGSFIYYKFDANGHKLAKDNIIPKITTEKVPEITVKGTLEGDIIKVSSIALK